MDMKENKKGMSVGSLLPLGITFVVLGIAFAIGASVLSSTQAGFTAGTYEYNSTQAALEGINTFSGWLDTIALVLVASVIIGILVVYLARRFA